MDLHSGEPVTNTLVLVASKGDRQELKTDDDGVLTID